MKMSHSDFSNLLRGKGWEQIEGQWVRIGVHHPGVEVLPESLQLPPKPPKRIRQSTKPLMNNLEQRFFDSLGRSGKVVHAQAITFRLANGVRFTPDMFCFDWLWQGDPRPVAWEVKGPWFTDDAKVKIKLFAAAYPKILVLLVWEDKDSGQWLNQIVHP